MFAKLIRVLLVLLVVLVSSMKMQPYYKKVFEVRERLTELEFSEVLDDFLYVSYQYDTIKLKQVKMAEDMHGRQYSNYEYMALRPMSNYSQLMHEGRYPDTIRGVHLTQEMMQTGARWPVYFSRSKGLSGLKWMFESNTNKLKMDLPRDMFRITGHGIEFVDEARNRILGVNDEKSKLFNDEMQKTGVLFPIKKYYGNPTTEKTKDDGYFIIDAKDDFFQLKMADGKPVCFKIPVPSGVTVEWMYCLDDSRIFGYVFSPDGMYALRLNDYAFVQLPLSGYEDNGNLIIIEENYFFITIRMFNDVGTLYYILDKNFNLVASKLVEYPPGYDQSKAGLRENYLFPFRSKIASGGGYHLEVKWYDWHKFIFLNMALMVILVGIKIFKRCSFRNPFNYLDFLTVLLCGIYGFIAVLVFPNRR